MFYLKLEQYYLDDQRNMIVYFLWNPDRNFLVFYQCNSIHELKNADLFFLQNNLDRNWYIRKLKKHLNDIYYLVHRYLPAPIY